MKQNNLTGTFLFQPPEAAPVGSVLFEEHLKLTGKSHMAAFAGYLMPLWYSSIAAEHKAVRQAAGLFDCTHMGVLEVAGQDAAASLNSITTNEIRNLNIGAARYSYILDAAGNALDDIIIYALAQERFMVVVNAANEPKIKAYLHGLQNDQVIIDAETPERKLQYKPTIRDMRDPKNNDDCRVDIALQGPKSIDLLSKLMDKESRASIENLKPFHLIESQVQNIDCIIARTGYTGAKTGFELFVHPAKAPQLWSGLLQSGQSLGLLPCGLGARDSLRIEAGLPLYGHELAGEFNISPFEAGYGWAVKLEKEFFVGKAAMTAKSLTYDMMVARIKLPGQKGVRPVRQNDGILDNSGRCVGWVLSCAKVGEKQIALAYVSREAIKENDLVGIYYLARSQSQISQGRKQSIEKADSLQADLTGMVVSRFAKF